MHRFSLVLASLTFASQGRQLPSSLEHRSNAHRPNQQSLARLLLGFDVAAMFQVSGRPLQGPERLRRVEVPCRPCNSIVPSSRPAHAQRIRMEGTSADVKSLEDVVEAEKLAKWKLRSKGLGGFKPKSKAKRSEQKKQSAGKGFGAPEKALNYDKRPKADAPCACGSGQPYGLCCAMTHELGEAKDPESLMRARFSALAYRLPQFVIDTTHPDGPDWKSDRKAWMKEILGYCGDFDWLEHKLLSDFTFDDEGSAKSRSASKMFRKKDVFEMAAIEEEVWRKTDQGTWLAWSSDVTYGAVNETF
mmetsp:Transcript_25282/g.43286  ORF Transcript_25282/g.43286 Transcript_25282/m.43286 type:complete len:303 (-) Transcript_25282:6-914(-)